MESLKVGDYAYYKSSRSDYAYGIVQIIRIDYPKQDASVKDREYYPKCWGYFILSDFIPKCKSELNVSMSCFSTWMLEKNLIKLNFSDERDDNMERYIKTPVPAPAPAPAPTIKSEKKLSRDNVLPEDVEKVMIQGNSVIVFLTDGRKGIANCDTASKTTAVAKKDEDGTTNVTDEIKTKGDEFCAYTGYCIAYYKAHYGLSNNIRLALDGCITYAIKHKYKVAILKGNSLRKKETQDKSRKV